ncbi:unnamed protein product [Orchesella dallaii]|uniref:Chitin-binding type-2 domain-containing protein n=1 Tax=Orchesella dallaii TaxID=48710 RepID=A0ABP1Q5R9_9HEXA
MLLPRRTHREYPFLLPCLLGLVTVIFLCGEFTNAQNYSDSPPRYNYNTLPRTSFTCKGKLPGRYYPDPETDCQMFHVCVKMNSRDVKDFKFLCPNGTVFDAENQVCIDFYQVVCHTNVGTNPLGHIFEIYKLSADKREPDLDAGKLSFVSRDSIQKNTLGDDFQVEEYNNNRLATSQNALNFRPSPEAPVRRTNKQKEDIFFNNKGFVPSTYQAPSTTRRTTTSTTTTTTTTEAPSSSTPRRPSLETFESYETESFSGFIPTRNSFGRGHDPTPDFDASTEDFTTKDERPYRTSTTARPLVFQNTFRTTLSHVPPTSKPSAQTFQQQPTRFNDQYFTRIPSTTRRPVSKAAQFFRHTTSADDYFTPEYRQPTVNPFVHQAKSTTIRPSLVFQGNLGTLRPNSNTDYQYETTTTVAPTTTTYRTTTDFPTTTEFFSRQRHTEEFEARQTTTYNNDFTQSARNSNFFNLNSESNKNKPRKQEFGGKSQTAPQRQFPPQLSTQYVEEETLRPRNIHGGSSSKNSFSQSPQPAVISSTRPRDNFGFSTVPPPTTAEPYSTPPPTTAAAVTQQETAQTLAARLQGRQLFQKVTAKTSKNPEKYSIFFGRSTHSVSDDRLPSPGPTTVLYYDSPSSTTSRPIRTRSTTSSPQEYENTPAAQSLYDRRGRSRINLISSTSTVAPDEPTSSAPSPRPRGRGLRRRVRPGRRQHGNKEFDPQAKYARRRFEAGRVQDKEQSQKNDEIFNAEASVFRGDPTINNFFQGQRKEATSGSKSNDKDEQPQKQRQPVNPYATEQFYGRRVRPNGNNGRVPQSQSVSLLSNNSSPANNIGEGPRVPPGPGPQRPEIRRRVVKRIRPKTTTAEPGSEFDNIETKKEFVVTGSTLRPVTRINVKTKLGGKIATTYRTTEITEASSTSRPTSSTTEEPELITASEDEIERKRQHKNPPSTSATQKPSFPEIFKKQHPSNESHLVIKVISDKPFPSSQQSIKKPALEKKVAHPGNKKVSTNKGEEESNTRSPDYDYAYYNSDDGSDYVAETSKIDHKNYGKKPRGEKK